MQMFRGMNISEASRKGGFAIVVLVVFAALLSALGINQIRFGGEMHRVNQQLHEFNADILPPPEYLVEPYLLANLLVTSPRNTAETIAQLGELEKVWRERAEYWAASDIDSELKDGIARTVKEDGEAFWKVVNQRLVPAAQRADAGAKSAALSELDTIYVRHRSLIDQLVDTGERLQHELDDSATTTVVVTLLGLTLVGALVLGSVWGGIIILRRKVISPLGEIADTMQQVATGDLEVGKRSYHSDDEIGTMTKAIEIFREAAVKAREADADRQRVVQVLRERLSAMAAGNLNEPIEEFLPESYKGIRMDFNQAQDALRSLIDAVSASSEQIRFSARDVNDAASDLSERAARQAATLEETVAALQRANSGIQSSSQLAQDTNAEVALARQNATNNRQIVEDAVDAMHQIQVAFAEVTQITDIIQNIAFQTNILALNAGVEAVRAGEAGKGFGVVATEVRALAQRSSEAVSSIQQLMSQSGERIENGARQVAASGTALREMIAIIDRVSERIGELASASLSQANDLNEIDSAISSLEHDTHQNAAMAEQSSAASGLLNQEVKNLVEKTAMFTDHGNGTSARRSQPNLKRAA